MSGLQQRIERLEQGLPPPAGVGTSAVAADWRSSAPGEEYSLPVSIVLAEYVERIKRIRLDAWQTDVCEKLDLAFRVGGVRAAIHAFPQGGKSIIISQCQPAYLLGQDPAHRFRLATYNVLHSARFSRVVQNILRSPEHKAIFKDKDSWIPNRCSYVEWSTYGRLAVNDGQASFTSLGLKSGFVGTGADTLVMDDPYKSAEEAYSQVIRDSTWRFWEDTARPRVSERSNVFIMFHRYHQDDQGGRAIASGEFTLWRYAAKADGEYVDEETGLTFPDPLDRREGEYLTLRPPFTETYYLRQQKNPQVWNSQFQGRPTSKTGDFFNVSLLQEIDTGSVPPLLHRVRAWDNAATEGAGAFSVGVLMGVDSSENYYVEDVERAQVDTAGREKLQQSTAERDGKLVSIRHPQDPGSAGKDVAFNVRQKFKDYQIETILVSGSKESRAYNFSKAVNSGRVFIVTRGGEKPAWLKPFRDVLKNFPVGTYKDDVDAGADAFNHLDALFHRGLVVKGFDERVGLVEWKTFSSKFGGKIPAHWEVAASLRVAPDASLPSAWAITARAAEDAWVGEAVFVVASRRLYANDPGAVIADLKSALETYCSNGVSQAFSVWLGKGLDVVELAAVKHDLGLQLFADEETAGLPETNWYFRRTEGEHPFHKRVGASRCYLLVGEESDQMHLRQDLTSWSYNERGEPQPYGGVVADCVRMTLYNFALSATELTKEQKRHSKLPDHLKDDAVHAKLHTEEFTSAYWAQQHALSLIKKEEEKEEREEREAWGKVMGRAVQHGNYRR